MPDQQAPDEVERQLARLAAAGERLAQLPDAAEIHRRARRRRRARALRAALGVLLVAALAIQGRALLDRSQSPLLPANPAPSVSTTVMPTTTQPRPTTPRAPTTLAPSPIGVARFSVAPSGRRVTLAGGGCSAHARVYLAWTAAVNPVNVENIGTVTAHADGTFQTTWVVASTMRAVPIRISAACDGRLLGSDILTVR